MIIMINKTNVCVCVWMREDLKLNNCCNSNNSLCIWKLQVRGRLDCLFVYILYYRDKLPKKSCLYAHRHQCFIEGADKFQICMNFTRHKQLPSKTTKQLRDFFFYNDLLRFSSKTTTTKKKRRRKAKFIYNYKK